MSNTSKPAGSAQKGSGKLSPATGPTSLEPHETSGAQPLPEFLRDDDGLDDPATLAAGNKRAVEFRHSGWEPDRARVLASLIRTAQPQRRIDAFCTCGANAFLHTDGQDLWICASFCRDRLCIPCQVARRAQLVEALLTRMHEVTDRVRFITLTLKCQPVPLAAQLDRLVDCFKRLRKTDWWKSRVAGGAFFIEVKLGKNSHSWHAHLHILAEGQYLKQYDLAEQWHKVTGDSYIVDISEVRDPLRRARYVTKYATKPADQSVITSPAHLDEFVAAIKGRRLYQCFGNWKSLTTADDEAPPREGRCLGPLDALHRRAVAGDAEARRWIEAATRKWPTLANVFPLDSQEHDPP